MSFFRRSKMKDRTKVIWEKVKDYAIIAFGLLIYAIAWNVFIFPHGVTGGGATGISAIVMYATQGMLSPEWEQFFENIGMYSQMGGVPITVTYLLLNIVFLLITMHALGREFIIRTLYGAVVVSLWFWIPFRDLYNAHIGVFPTFDPFMSIIMGGVLIGIGMGICFSRQGSSGGTDILVKFINKHHKIPVGKAMLFIDTVIIISGGFLPGKGLESITYGLIMLLVISYTIDMYLNGLRQSVQFFIFSNHYEEIAETITVNAHRGVTLLDGKGWYTKKNIQVITVLTRRSESTAIFRIVRDIDPEALISQASVMGVYGSGFNSIDDLVVPSKVKTQSVQTPKKMP